MVVQVAGRDRLGRVSEGVGRGYWRQGWGEVLLPLLPPASPALATATATGAVPALPVTCLFIMVFRVLTLISTESILPIIYPHGSSRRRKVGFFDSSITSKNARPPMTKESLCISLADILLLALSPV